MARRCTIVAALVLPIGFLLLAPAIASAGGGCHAGVTTAFDGSTVAMADACFTPTILHVDRGETVRFVNKDAMAHNVTANLWGHFEDLYEGDDFRVTFEDPGVYPFACTLHPGMSGAIVVADGTGAGNGDVIVTPVAGSGTRPPEGSAGATGASTGSAGGSGDPQVATSPVSVTDEGGSMALAWIGGAALGLVLGGAVGRFARRRSPTVRRSRPA